MPKKPTGRPPLYNDRLAGEICARLAKGESLVSICKDPGMPDYTVVMDWRHKHEDFAQKYMRAREDQADTLADEVLNESRKAASGQADPQGVRVLVDALKWRAGKLKPKVYGDRLNLDADVKLEDKRSADEILAAVKAELSGLPPDVAAALGLDGKKST